jgi:biotin operon repressor
MKTIKRPKHLFTKDEAKKLLTLWEGSTKQQIADKLEIRIDQVSYLATQMKKSGFKLQRKSSKGYLNGMLKDLYNELRK